MIFTIVVLFAIILAVIVGESNKTEIRLRKEIAKRDAELFLPPQPSKRYNCGCYKCKSQ